MACITTCKEGKKMVSLSRRVVTGNDERGRSRVVIDDAPSRRGITADIWLSGPGLLSEADADTVQSRGRLAPPRQGSVFRFFLVAPEEKERQVSDEEREQLYSEYFESMDAPHARPNTSRHPGMHQTATIDYIVVLTGEVTLLLDDSEAELKPFDVVVQRGTNHAWVNYGKDAALLMAVLIDDSKEEPPRG
jgi:hypothetical protein